MRWFSLLMLLSWLGIAAASSASGNRLLVILDDLAEKERYTKFFGDLEGRGFDISYDAAKSEKIALIELGERAYDHLLLLPTKSRALGPNLTPLILLQFINAEGNVLLTLSSENPTPTSLVSLLLEFDIHLPSERNALVVDHFNYDVLSAADKHDVVLVPLPNALRPDVKNFFGGKSGQVVAFPRGVGQSLGNDATLLAPVLRAPSTAYSYNPKDDVDTVEDPFGVGQQLSLVSSMQALNSARFTVLGSAELLEDAWFSKTVKPSGSGKDLETSNQEFAKQVSGWTFNEIGILKVGRVEHYLNESPDAAANSTNPKMYRVKNTVTYSAELSEYAWDKLVPFVPASEDEVQLEFSMLSPFHRLNLSPSRTTANSTVYTTTFKLPDQHGIFNFMLSYKRPFFSNVENKDTVTVRHFAHDEWPRSFVISAAWPWISGIGATIIGWLAFVAIWLYSAPVATKLASNVRKIQ